VPRDGLAQRLHHRVAIVFLRRLFFACTFQRAASHRFSEIRGAGGDRRPCCAFCGGNALTLHLPVCSGHGSPAEGRGRLLAHQHLGQLADRFGGFVCTLHPSFAELAQALIGQVVVGARRVGQESIAHGMKCGHIFFCQLGGALGMGHVACHALCALQPGVHLRGRLRPGSLGHPVGLQHGGFCRPLTLGNTPSGCIAQKFRASRHLGHQIEQGSQVVGGGAELGQGTIGSWQPVLGQPIGQCIDRAGRPLRITLAGDGQRAGSHFELRHAGHRALLVRPMNGQAAGQVLHRRSQRIARRTPHRGGAETRRLLHHLPDGAVVTCALRLFGRCGIIGSLHGLRLEFGRCAGECGCGFGDAGFQLGELPFGLFPHRACTGEFVFVDDEVVAQGSQFRVELGYRGAGCLNPLSLTADTGTSQILARGFQRLLGECDFVVQVGLQRLAAGNDVSRVGHALPVVGQQGLGVAMRAQSLLLRCQHVLQKPRPLRQDPAFQRLGIAADEGAEPHGELQFAGGLLQRIEGCVALARQNAVVRLAGLHQALRVLQLCARSLQALFCRPAMGSRMRLFCGNFERQRIFTGIAQGLLELLEIGMRTAQLIRCALRELRRRMPAALPRGSCRPEARHPRVEPIDGSVAVNLQQAALVFAAAHQRPCPPECRVCGVRALLGCIRLFQLCPRLLQPGLRSGQRGVVALDLGRFLEQRLFASIAMALELLHRFKRHRLLAQR
jgi:hypothetical protein